MKKWTDPLTKAERAEYNKLHDKAEIDSRICLSIAYFRIERDAERFGQLSAKAGNTYNGGWFHGMICGREEGRDYGEGAERKYAATF